MRLPNVVRTLLDSEGVLRRARLIYADFLGDPHFMWEGFGDFRSNDGIVWRGIGDSLQISGGAQQEGVVAGNLKIELAATPAMIAKAKLSEDMVYGRRFAIANQFCDANWQPVDDYFYSFVGVMDQMMFTGITATSGTITLNVEDVFARLSAERNDFFSDRSRKAKYPDDRLFEGISQLKNKKLVF